MNLIKELTEKYGGEYATDHSNLVANFEIEGTKISIHNKNAVSLSPCYIQLHLNGDFQTSLEITPRSKFQKMIDSILLQKGRKIEQEFSIAGNLNLRENLVSNRKLSDLLSGEKVCLKIEAASPEIICLYPEEEIQSLIQFEKYLSILRLIEKKIFQLQLTAAY